LVTGQSGVRNDLEHDNPWGLPALARIGYAGEPE
jgi:DNA-binding MarR family transcriptional regulator